MNQTGETQPEEARITYNEQLTEKIQELTRVDISDDISPEEEIKKQKEANNLRRERFTNSNTDERIDYLNQALLLLGDWSEAHDNAEIKISRIYEEWGFVPTPESLPSELKEAIEKIKENNKFLTEDQN